MVRPVNYVEKQRLSTKEEMKTSKQEEKYSAKVLNGKKRKTDELAVHPPFAFFTVLTCH